MKMKNKSNIYKGDKDFTIKNKLLKKVTKLNDREYTTNISAWDLAEMWEKDELVYFADYQRGLTSKKVNGKIKEDAIVNQTNISEIQELILKGDYITEQIILNVLQNGKEELIYDDDTEELLISGVFTALDGNHRLRASHRAYLAASILRDREKINNVKNTKFSVKITHFNNDDAKAAFVQLSKGMRISASRREFFDMSQASNRICEKLSKKSILKGLIETKYTHITVKDTEHLVAFATLNKAVKENFPSIKNEEEENEIYNFLELFFEELVKIFPEMVNSNERAESKKVSLICENMMFHGYLNIAQELYLKRKSKTWKDQLKALGKIDFDKENDMWDCVIKKLPNSYRIINNDKSRDMMCRVLKEQYYMNQE